MDDWELVEAARLALADFGESLTATQWDAQTLCERWRARHVFAHVVVTTSASIGSFLPALVRSGLRPSEALAQWAIRKGDRTSGDDLVRELRRVAPTRKSLPGIEPGAFVADVLVHAEDIRRPMSIRADYDAAQMLRALDTSTRAPSAHGVQRRIEGLRLVATDVDWSHGDGPEVRGSGADLLLTMWGRSAALPAIDGPGRAVMASRFPS